MSGSTPCSYKLPTTIDIATYFPRINDIMTQLANNNNKDIAVERLNTLIAELNIVINDNSGNTVYPITTGAPVKSRKKKVCNC
jgi:hypothetical protein